MVMKKCIIWGTGKIFAENIRLLQYYETSGLIEVIGVTSNDLFYESVLTYRYIPKNQIKNLEFDYLICAVDNKVMKIIQGEALEMGIDIDCMIPVSVMKLPGFDFDKYVRIRNNVPTILTPHCWGGVTYNRLALPFNSPFINMFEQHDDYIRFLKNPKYYMECPLEFVEMRYESDFERYYPVAKCGDVMLYFNHYESFEEADKCWNRRKERINWDNLLVEFYDADRGLVEEFLNLPYEKKICFVPFQMKHKNVVSLYDGNNDNSNPLWEKVMGTANGFCYDVFELFLNNEIVLISGLK